MSTPPEGRYPQRPPLPPAIQWLKAVYQQMSGATATRNEDPRWLILLKLVGRLLMFLLLLLLSPIALVMILISIMVVL